MSKKFARFMRGKQPHPDECQICHRGCYAADAYADKGDGLIATYSCPCGNAWKTGWALMYAIDDPDPTPENCDAQMSLGSRFTGGGRRWHARRDHEIDDEREIKARLVGQFLNGESHSSTGDLAMRPYVKLYLDGEKAAISTNITDEREFIFHVAHAFPEASEHAKGAVFAAQLYLPLIVDLCCKLRGYKAPLVEEERVLLAGKIQPSEGSLISTALSVRHNGYRAVVVQSDDNEPQPIESGNGQQTENAELIAIP